MFLTRSRLTFTVSRVSRDPQRESTTTAQYALARCSPILVLGLPYPGLPLAHSQWLREILVNRLGRYLDADHPSQCSRFFFLNNTQCPPVTRPLLV
jgi:hypothetical protein